MRLLKLILIISSLVLVGCGPIGVELSGGTSHDVTVTHQFDLTGFMELLDAACGEDFACKQTLLLQLFESISNVGESV